MKRMDKVYIQLEIGMAEWNVDINNNAVEDILDEGIDCYPEEEFSVTVTASFGVMAKNQEDANKYKDSITDKTSQLLGDNKGPKFDPTADFMGLNTANQMVQQQVC